MNDAPSECRMTTVRATAGEMGLDYVNTEVRDEALSIGKKGNVLKRFLAERQVREDGAIVLELDLTVDRDSVEKVISTRKSALNCDPSPNGMILNDNGTFSITPAKEGVKLLRVAPHQVLFTAFFICTTMLSLTMIGDGLRDAFDPRLRGTE